MNIHKKIIRNKHEYSEVWYMLRYIWILKGKMLNILRKIKEKNRALIRMHQKINIGKILYKIRDKIKLSHRRILR